MALPGDRRAAPFYTFRDTVDNKTAYVRGSPPHGAGTGAVSA